MLVLETNKIVETCEVTFDETSLGTRSSDAGTSTHVQGEAKNIFVDDDEEEKDKMLIHMTQSALDLLAASTTSTTVGYP